MNYKKISYKTDSQSWTRKSMVCLFFETERVYIITRSDDEELNLAVIQSAARSSLVSIGEGEILGCV